MEQKEEEWREREGRGGEPWEGRGSSCGVDWSAVECSGVQWSRLDLGSRVEGRGGQGRREDSRGVERRGEE